jgi:hypothetical protein
MRTIRISRRVAFVLILVGCTVLLFTPSVNNCNPLRIAIVRHSAAENVCGRRMRTVDKALREVANSLRARGRILTERFDPNHLLCRSDTSVQDCLEEAEACCNLTPHGSHPWAGWVWLHQWNNERVKQFLDFDEGQPPFIVLCHEPDKLHRDTTRGMWRSVASKRGTALILLSDSRVVSCDVAQHEYANWLNHSFRKGDCHIPQFLESQLMP